MTGHPRAALAAAVTLCLSATAQAAVVCSGPAGIDVPATGEGLYINFVTGVSAEAESQVTGFDFDPYAAQSSTPEGQLRFYWGSSANPNAGVVTSGDIYAVLAPGDVVGPDRVFSRQGFGGVTTAWRAGITGYLGTRFRNEGTGVLNYGWVRLATTAPLGFPLTIVDWCYDDAGGPITIEAPDPIFADGFDPAAE